MLKTTHSGAQDRGGGTEGQVLVLGDGTIYYRTAVCCFQALSARRGPARARASYTTETLHNENTAKPVVGTCTGRLYYYVSIVVMYMCFKSFLLPIDEYLVVVNSLFPESVFDATPAEDGILSMYK